MSPRARMAMFALAALATAPARAEAPVAQVGEVAPGTAPEPAPAPAASPSSASLEGRVLWGAQEPHPAALARNAEPYCARLGSPLDESISVSAGGLANVLVRVRVARPLPTREGAAAARGHPSKPAPSAPGASRTARPEEPREEEHSVPARVSLASCAFAPRVLALQPGQHLIVESGDPILHALRLTHERAVVYRRSLQRDQPAPELRFSAPGVYRLGCDVHPWEVAWVVVAPPEDAPTFAVTDAQGHFRLENLPAGSAELDAWHEKAAVVGPALRLRAGATAHATLLARPPDALAHEDARPRSAP